MDECARIKNMMTIGAKKMENKELYYQESGQVSVSKQVMSYVISIGLVLLLGYLYSVVMIFIPIVYLNFLITVGYALLLVS